MDRRPCAWQAPRLRSPAHMTPSDARILADSPTLSCGAMGFDGIQSGTTRVQRPATRSSAATLDPVRDGVPIQFPQWPLARPPTRPRCPTHDLLNAIRGRGCSPRARRYARSRRSGTSGCGMKRSRTVADLEPAHYPHTADPHPDPATVRISGDPRRRRAALVNELVEFGSHSAGASNSPPPPRP